MRLTITIISYVFLNFIFELIHSSCLRLDYNFHGIPKLSTVHEPKPNHTFIKAGASGFRYQYLLKHSCGVFVIKSISCKTVGLTLGLTSPIPKNEKRLGTYSVAGPLHPHA